MRTLKKMIDYAHDIVRSVVKEGDIVIDATVGNGNDTIFLAELVGNSGKVYGFDIQKVAIDIANESLQKANLLNKVQLINDSHQNVSQYVHDKVKAAMFNLGYLPGGNQNIITSPLSTVFAITNIMSILQVGGIITIIIYYGHNGGIKEMNSVLDYVSNLDSSYYSVQKIEVINNNNTPPILVCIEKIN